MTPRDRHRLAALGAALLLAACGAGARPEKPRRSALWVAAGQAPAAGDLARLAQVGIEEIFVEAAELSFAGGVAELTDLPLPTLPRRTAATLVVRGRWPGDDADAERFAAALDGALAAQVARAEGHRLVPVGFHFDLDPGGGLAGYGAALRALRARMPPSRFLSASLERRWLDAPGVEAVVGGVDFTVAFLYGQRPGRPDDEAAWDLVRIATALERLDARGRDFFLGVVTVGTASLLDPRGGVREVTTEAALGSVARNPDLEPSHEFSLRAVDRQSYRFRARQPVLAGPWRLAPGEEIEVVRISGRNLRELQRRLGSQSPAHHLGELYFRLPDPAERLSLSVEGLYEALAPGDPPPPAPRAEVLTQEGPGGRHRIVVAVTNPSPEPTGMSRLLDFNYVELEVYGGSIGRVEPGQFRRWELLTLDHRGERVRAFRGATLLRLYIPLLEGRERVVSGPVEVPRGAKFSLSGRFILPDGATVEVAEGPAPEG